MLEKLLRERLQMLEDGYKRLTLDINTNSEKDIKRISASLDRIKWMYQDLKQDIKKTYYELYCDPYGMDGMFVL